MKETHEDVVFYATSVNNLRVSCNGGITHQQCQLLAESPPLHNPNFDLITIIRVTFVRSFIEECLDQIPHDA